jgi:hypothetical protein
MSPANPGLVWTLFPLDFPRLLFYFEYPVKEILIGFSWRDKSQKYSNSRRFFMKRLVWLSVLLGALLLFSSLTMAADEKKPDATIKMSEGQVAVGIGYSWGKGVLTYKGKDYPLTVKGLSVADVGITKAEASGVVYNLKKLEDFDGNYTGVTAEGTLGGGAGATSLKNQNGVIVNLVKTTKGINVKLAGSGVELKLKK